MGRAPAVGWRTTERPSKSRPGLATRPVAEPFCFAAWQLLSRVAGMKSTARVPARRPVRHTVVLLQPLERTVAQPARRTAWAHARARRPRSPKGHASTTRRRTKQNLRHTLTSESVSEGHPDKVCDYIADSILDAYLAGDRSSRVACEVLCKTDMVVLAGEITSSAQVDHQQVAREAVRQIGYTDPGEP